MFNTDDIQLQFRSNMIDLASKRLLEICAADWVRLVQPNIKEVHIRPLPTNKVAKLESRLDSLFEVNGELVVHIETQGYYDAALPWRMLRYRVDVAEAYIASGLCVPKIYQCVVFFEPKDMNIEPRIHETVDGHIVLDYNYGIIKVWEVSAEYVLENRISGLYSLLPLMKWKADIAKKDVLEKTVTAIQSVENPSKSKDMFEAMSMLCNKVFTKEEIMLLFSKEFLIQKTKESELLMEIFGDLYGEKIDKNRQEGLKEGLKEGRQEEKLEMAQRLYKLGVPMEQIIKAAKLPKRTITKHLLSK